MARALGRIDGKRVLITGASSGIGAEIARQLGARGCKVALAARRRERLEEVAEEVRKAGGEGLVVPCDVADREGLTEALQKAEAELGGYDVALLNAGLGSPTPVTRYDAGTVEHIFRVNVFGVVYAMEAILPGFLERGTGTIAGVSSLAAYRGLPVSTAYGGSKAALTNMMEGMRIELAAQGITLVVVSPGFVKSELTDKNKFEMPFMWPTDKAAARIIRGIEKGRREVAFPFPLVATLSLAKLFPNWLWDTLASTLSPRAGMVEKRAETTSKPEPTADAGETDS